MKTITFDSQKYSIPTWDEMGKLCFELAAKIIADNKRFDRIVALAKGGLTWSRVLADYVEIEDISAVHVRFYREVYATNKKPVIVQSLPVSVEGESILVLDDVADSGETLALTSDYLQLCGVKQVETAVLFLKPWSKFTPAYHAATADAWIVFPGFNF